MKVLPRCLNQRSSSDQGIISKQLYKDIIAKEVGVRQHLTPGSSDGNLSLAIKSLAGATAKYLIAEHTRQSASSGSDVETPKACMKHVKWAMFGMETLWLYKVLFQYLLIRILLYSH